MIFRRKRLPAGLAEPHSAFTAQVERLEAARSALMSCLPVGRVDPAPVPVGLDLLDDVLAELDRELPAWRRPELEEAWLACAAAIREARRNIPKARAIAASSRELEELLGAIEDVDEPLGHAFGLAEDAFRGLRVRA